MRKPGKPSICRVCHLDPKSSWYAPRVFLEIAALHKYNPDMDWYQSVGEGFGRGDPGAPKGVIYMPNQVDGQYL
jgi:hypothetical protein